jgi:hypothetical protein
MPEACQGSCAEHADRAQSEPNHPWRVGDQEGRTAETPSRAESWRVFASTRSASASSRWTAALSTSKSGVSAAPSTVGRSEPVTCGPTPSVDGGNARFALRLGADGTGDGRGEGASPQRDGGASRGPKGVWTGATSELGDDGICAQGLLSTSGRTTNRMYAPAAWTVWTGQMVACGVGLAVIPRRVPGRRCAGRVPATSATIYDRFDRGVVKVLSREQLSVDGTFGCRAWVVVRESGSSRRLCNAS